MMDHVLVHSNGRSQIIYVFAEAYGYSQEPWNMPQDVVMSHLLTFLNHGCNGTSNMGDDVATLGITEFSIDLESDDIPSVLSTRVDVPFCATF
jgi:hypothetical protein